MLPFDETAWRAALNEIDDLREALDARGPLPLVWEGQLRRDLEASAVQASVELEGVAVTVEEVRRILAGDAPARVAPADIRAVEGYRDAMRYVQSRADDRVFEWSSELLKGIHHRVVAGDRSGGRYGGARFVSDRATGELIYTPPQDGVPELVDELCERLNQWEAHPSLRAAWVHVAFAAVHPFKDGNGRSARILASLAMYRGGFKRPEFCSLEEWWGHHKDTYYGAFRCLGTAFDPMSDVTPFMRAHVDAQRSQVRALAMREETERVIWSGLSRVAERLGLPDRTAFALWDAYNDREITRPYYRSITDISQMTATKDFQALRAARLLTPRGRTRARVYVTGERLFARLGAEVGAPGAEGRPAIIDAVTARLAKARAARS